MTGEPIQVEGDLRAPWRREAPEPSGGFAAVNGARRSPSTHGFARLLFVFCAVWACVFARAARADTPSLTATLSDNVTTVSEPVDLRVTITGAAALGSVQLPEVDGLSIQLRRTWPSIQINNFALTEQLNHLFTVTPQRAGIFTIPETEVQVGARRLRTPKLTLTVTPAANNNNGGGGRGNNASGAQVRAEILLPKKTAYVGESLPAEFRLTFGSRIELVEPGDIILVSGQGFTIGRWTQLQGSGLRLWGGGSTGQRLLHKTIITPARAGTLTVGPGETDPIVRVLPAGRSRSNDPFADDPLGGLLGPVFAPPRQVKLVAEPVTLEVKPLPTAGQPADFTGGVGRFELGASEVISPARGTVIRAGDPVTVRLTVRGQGSFDRLGAPLPESTEGLRAYDPKDRFKADDDVGLIGTKTFEQTFIPTGPRDHVPGFHLSYFDPVTGTYQTLRAPPLPLRVLPGVVAAVPAPTPGPAAAASPPAAAPPAAEETLRPSHPEPGVPLAADALRPVYLRRGFWQWQLLPLTLLLTLLAALRTRARRRDGAVQRAAARAREREKLWRTVRDPRAARPAFLDAAARLLDLAPVDDADVASIRARHAELAYGGEDHAADLVPPEERAEVLMILRGRAGASSLTRAALTPVSLFLLVGLPFAVVNPSARAARAETNFHLGNQLAAEGKHEEAAGLYAGAKRMARSGLGSIGVNNFYNLGNAYVHLGQRGRAVVEYRRTLLGDPRHADALANLALMRRQLRVPEGAVLPPALPPWLTDHLPTAALVHGGNVGAWVAAFGGWLFLGGMAVALWPGLGSVARRRARRVTLGAGLPLTLLGLAAAGTLSRPAREAARTAVVITKRADAHEGPADNAKTVGTLTEGCEVRLVLARGPWTLVTLADGRPGYVPAAGLEVVGER